MGLGLPLVALLPVARVCEFLFHVVIHRLGKVIVGEAPKLLKCSERFSRRLVPVAIPWASITKGCREYH